MKGPTERTLKSLRDAGYICQVVERWNQFAKKRIDLFGFIDIVAIKDNQIIGVQTTSASNHAARVKKILAENKAWYWYKAGGLIQVRSWRKRNKKKKDGTKGKGVEWVERVEEVHVPF